MRPSSSCRIATLILPLAFLSCAAAAPPPDPAAPEKGVVLLRTYYVPLARQAGFGPAHPPLDRFAFGGALPASEDGKAQRAALRSRFTLTDLDFQFSHAVPLETGKTAVLEMGFGERIQVRVSDFSSSVAGERTATYDILFGQRTVLHQRLPHRGGEVFLFAGRLDPGLPILSVFSVEIRTFAAGRDREYIDFLEQPRRDFEQFAPPPPKQRAEEPFLPGVGDVTMPELISSTQAVYPDAARPEKLDGQVIVEVVVDREGRATRPRILTPPSVFDASALEASRTYRYRPATRNGKPVAVTMNLILIYKFSAKSGF